MDNVVDTMDAYLVLLYYARVSVGMEDCKLNEEQDTFTNRWLLLLVDVNGDNQIDTMDAYYILLYYAMKSAGFETSWDIVLQ